mmetsp:Transcript_114395/g.363550  ORF Transcript_114395/g.363550 Transcript_114395/m.363550 type:complete len:391 (-) Transcript_114395:1007-2179(-)
MKRLRTCLGVAFGQVMFLRWECHQSRVERRFVRGEIDTAQRFQVLLQRHFLCAFQPRRGWIDPLCTRETRSETAVSELQDILHLVVFCLVEHLLTQNVLVITKHYQRVELFQILSLQSMPILNSIQFILLLDPHVYILHHVLLCRHNEFVRNSQTSQHRLQVEHDEGVHLVLHTQVHEFGPLDEEYAFVEILNDQCVVGARFQLGRKEGEGVLIAGANDNHINVLLCSIQEVHGMARHMGQQWNLRDACWPRIAHGVTVCDGDAGSTKLVTLQRNVFGGQRTTDCQDAFPCEAPGIPEIFGVQHLSGESLDSCKLGNVRNCKMAIRNNDEVEVFSGKDTCLPILGAELESTSVVVPCYTCDLRLETNVVGQIVLLCTTLDVICNGSSRRV